MNLNVHEWRPPHVTTDSRSVVLLHGYGDDGRSWHRLSLLLAERGYRVNAVDLRGHGQSPRSDDYSLTSLVADVMETLPLPPDAAIGHSFGGIVLGELIRLWNPGCAIYLDPGWTAFEKREDLEHRPQELPAVTEEQIRQAWADLDPQEVELRVEANTRLDPATWNQMSPLWWYQDQLPPLPDHRDSGGSGLVIAAADSVLVPPSLYDSIRDAGMDVRVAPRVGHLMHREDPHEVLACMSGYL